MAHLLMIAALVLPMAEQAVAADERHALIARVAELDDPCQQRGLALQLVDGLAPAQWRLPPPSGNDRALVLEQIWRSHLAHAYTGLAGQWDIAQWWRRGTAMMGQVYRGDRPASQVQDAFAQWQAQARTWSAGPAVNADGAVCAADQLQVSDSLLAALLEGIAVHARNGDDADF
jgi:hypothetical protein